MKFCVVLEYDAQAQSRPAVCPELPGCTSAGTAEEEARQGIAEAILPRPQRPALARERQTRRGNGWVNAVRLGLTADQVIAVLRRHGFLLAGSLGAIKNGGINRQESRSSCPIIGVASCR